MRSREVFPLKARPGKVLLYCLDELIHEVEISLSRDPFMTPAEVFGIVQPFRVVSANIQHDRQCSFRMNASDERVQGKLAYGNSKPPCALIANAQNALAIGHHDYINFIIRTVSQQLTDGVSQGIGDN